MQALFLAQKKFFFRTLLFVVFAIIPWLAVWLFRVNSIVCRVGEYPCPPDVQQALLLLKGKSFVFVSIQENLNQKLIAETGFKIVSVKKILPSMLQLQLQAQSPWYAVKSISGQELWIVTKTGQAFQASPEKTPEVPVFILDNDLPWKLDRDQVDSALHLFIGQLATALSLQPFEYQSNTIAALNQVVIHLPNGQHAVLDNQDPLVQVKRLELLLKENQQLPEGIVELDVRYQLPVLRTTTTIE